MVQGRQPTKRSLARWASLAVGLGLVLTYALTAQSPPLLQETLPSDAAPIQLNADHIASWKDGDKQVFLLRGNVIVSQGTTTIRSPDMAVWVDMQRYQREQVFHTLVYGDSDVRLERGTVAQAERGYVRLATTSKVDIKPFKSKLVEKDLSSDEVYQRALVLKPASLKETVVNLPKREEPRIDEMLRPAAYQPPPPPPAPDPPPPPPPTIPMSPEPKIAPIPDNNNMPLPPAPVPPKRTAISLSVKPRYQGGLDVRYEPSKTEPGVTAVVVSGGVALLIGQPAATPTGKATFVDIEADRLVIWTRGNAQQLFTNMSSQQGDEGGAHEVYMSGHVELRMQSDKSQDTLRADEVYYDFRRNVAVARKADLEMKVPQILMPIHVQTEEMIQVNPQLRQASKVKIFSGLLPSDPGLTFEVSDTTIQERKRERSYLFGLVPAYDKTGQRIVDTDHIFTGRNMFATLEGVPVFYFPYLRGRVEDPLGPLDAVNASYNNIFGAQFYTTWDIYDLLDLPHYQGTRWRLYLDYLSARGPAVGTEFDLAGNDYFGIKGNYLGMVKLYGIWDKKADVLGGDRGNYVYWPNQFTKWPIEHPDFRGIAEGRLNVQEMDNGFSVLGQFVFLRDRNFLEQYYLDSQLNDLNKDTYLRVKQQHANWAWTLYGQVSVREWMTETNWLPRADGYLLGQTFSFDRFEDLFVYNAHASAGFAQLMPTNVVPFAYLPTDVRANTARLDLWQDISMPFYLGPVKLAPYLAGDLTYYSEDVNGNQQGRLYGGAGVRGSMPLSRLYPDIQSDLFNVNQIYHKISLTGNYFAAQSSVGFNNLPQLNRLNDDSSDQALRDIRPWQPVFNPANAAFLTTSNLFNPQNYAIRRLVDTNPDTLDSINVFQLGLRQRWQTQRGFGPTEHTVDFMTLNLGVSIFPNANRDNFGNTFGILEYDWVWNIGDRTALTSTGWFEPVGGGPRAFDVGTIVNRPDGSTFYLGYRQVDPLNAKAVIGSFVYPFSAKYAFSANTVWDFGNDVTTYGIFLTRMGTDLMVNVGVNYNSTLSTFGIMFEVLPNLARRQGRFATVFPNQPINNIDPLLNKN